ncbi:MAG: hypothetical protein R1F52_01210 [Candidatus Nitrosoabyssus spongiisocia]|nr:MAG: hypothetical protein R1F52_01210 [Nitrosopumilaceae archaeon AB1(1)]
MESIIVKLLFVVIGVGGLGIFSSYISDIHGIVSNVDFIILNEQSIFLMEDQIRIILDISNIGGMSIDTVTIYIIDNNHNKHNQTFNVNIIERESFVAIFNGNFSQDTNYYLQVVVQSGKNTAIQDTVI